MDSGGVWPCRTLWPNLIFAYVIWCHDRKHTLKTYVIGYILCSMATIWTSDTGVVVCLAYSVMIWVRYWCDHPIFSVKMIKVYALTVLGSIGAVLMMIVTVNIYNILCGGELQGFKECFFPIGTPEMVSFAKTGLNECGYNWLVPVCTFMLAVAMGMLRTSIVGASKDDRLLLLAYLGIIGLGGAYYFTNRSVAGWFNVMYQFVLAAILFAELGRTAGEGSDSNRSLQGYGDNIRNHSVIVLQSAGVVGLIAACIFALNGMLWSQSLLSYRIGTGITSMDSMEAMAEDLKATVPEDTFAYGDYVTDVYAYLGWDTGHGYRNQSEIWNWETIVEDVNSQDHVLLGVSQKDIVRPDSGMLLAAVFPKDNPKLYYYAQSHTYVYADLTYTDENALSYADDCAVLYPGITQYGPYDQLGVGHYHVEIKGNNLDKVTYDAVFNGGANVIGTTLLQQTSDAIIYEFDLEEPVTNIEYRIFNNSQEDAEIVSITITR